MPILVMFVLQHQWAGETERVGGMVGDDEAYAFLTRCWRVSLLCIVGILKVINLTLEMSRLITETLHICSHKGLNI